MDYGHRATAMWSGKKVPKQRIQELQKQKAERKDKYDAFESFISAFASQEKSLTEFDEGMWCLLMETVTVHISGELEFRFKDGSMIFI